MKLMVDTSSRPCPVPFGSVQFCEFDMKNV